MDRKIIFETRVGSHLYGTNRSDSDEDFQGVFVPSKQDLLGIQNCPTEWSMNEKKSETIQNQKGDVDRKFYSLKRFLHLASDGQPGQLELLFATRESTVSYDSTWSRILDNTSLFLSRKSIVPFIGFALSQAHKATIKGENLNHIRELISVYGARDISSQLTISDVMGQPFERNGQLFVNLTKNLAFSAKLVTNLQGFTTVEIGGRNYDKNLKLKTFIANMKELEKRYGSRTIAAAEGKFDYKSLMHAYRLLMEGEELLTFGKITFPLAPEKVEFLKSVRAGQCGDVDHWLELTSKIDNLRQNVEPKSFLPKEPDHVGINKLCIDILSDSLKG